MNQASQYLPVEIYLPAESGCVGSVHKTCSSGALLMGGAVGRFYGGMGLMMSQFEAELVGLAPCNAGFVAREDVPS